MRLSESFCRNYAISVLLLTLIAFLSRCNEPPEIEIEDAEYISYVAYKKIYKAYHKVSADSTKLALEEYLKKYSTDSRAYTFYGRLLYEMNESDLSIAAYRNALFYNEMYVPAVSGLGAVYTLLHLNDSAELYLLRAIALKDSSPYTFLNLSMLYMNTGEMVKSFAFADSAFTKGGSLPPIVAGLCFIFHQQKREESSREMFARAASLGLADTAMFKEVLRGEQKIEDYYRANNY